ncbi:uncharacterized protein LOC125653288 isoform X2 [Ostrea edulis]|uniref:uncharacterized protein LOC125653288 isoform X2 n=1 Tax=Ostrea edulis TaxID=37623 RepID=UPI0024AF1C9F|nr:uncharacterized protein LOC125653288 isoform X2 [Ostrea edulis]
MYVSRGSILLKLTFSTERGYDLYKEDLKRGEIGKLILSVFLYPPYLANCNLQAEDLMIYLNDKELRTAPELVGNSEEGSDEDEEDLMAVVKSMGTKRKMKDVGKVVNKANLAQLDSDDDDYDEDDDYGSEDMSALDFLDDEASEDSDDEMDWKIMASSSNYASTPETTNANIACRAVLGPCTGGLRDILRHYVPPLTFPFTIKLKEDMLPRLTKDQRDLILPRHGSYTGNYGDMDISLLYILLRNISGIPPHSNGWGNDPDPRDSSLSANIERIRLVRNHCVYSCDPFMSNTDFNSIWSTIRSTMVDLDAFLVAGNKYEKVVDFLRLESMDPENDLHYEEELRKQVEEDKTIREIMVNLEKPNDIDVQKWKEEDKLYYETHSFPSMMEKVRNQPYVTFVGVPGSGKSATANHIALKLQEEGYKVVPTKDVRKMEDYGDPRNPQVFVIDDVVGVFGLQKTKLDVLTSCKEKITQLCMVKSRTLMTCREAVFNETLPYKSFLTKEETVIKLHSSDHALDNNDKKQILLKHGLNVDLISPAWLTSTSRMFPLLCKFFSKETKFQALGSKFFMNLVPCIIDALYDMQKHNKLNYATLVLCMLNENRLSENILKERKNEYFINMKNDTLENCELESQTDAFKVMDALSAMEGIYTKQCGAQYTFIHDSMFEICAYQYGKQFPDQILLYMSSSYIANYVKPQTSEPGMVHKVKEKQSDSQSVEGVESSDDGDGKDQESDDKNSEREGSFDLCIRLPEDQYPLLAERLYRDIQNMKLYDVFRNQVLKLSQVCQAFIGVLETKSYIELKSLFLSSQGNVDKIVSKRKRVVEESLEMRDWSESERHNVLVDQREKRDEWLRPQVLGDRRNKRGDKGQILYDEHTYNVRVISWVIYYGHHQILEYIVQQTEQHNEVGELFGITGNSPHQSKSGRYTDNKQQSEYNNLTEACRLLLLSCYSGDVQTVRILLPDCKKTINGIGRISEDTCWSRHSPLTAACEGGHESIVNELLKAGADVNLHSGRGNTRRIAARGMGYVSIAGNLVKSSEDVNQHDIYGNTPLMAACKGGHVSIVEELVKAGADVNLRDWLSWNTPLIAACKKGHISIVEKLVKAGAVVNLRGRQGNTPLIVAYEVGHLSVVKELVKAGANVNIQNIDGDTLLTAACRRGYLSKVEELVKAGADVNLEDDDGKTPLIAACRGGHISIVEKLVKAGADVNLQNRRGNTPLIVACEGGHVSMLEELMKAGADVNLQDDDSNTPLIAAFKGGHVNIVEELVKAGADVNIQDSYGYTPLIAACEKGHVSIVEELVKAGADVNLQGKYSNTPLRAACEGGHVSTVEYLVKAGADVNLQDSQKNTPLITACEKGHVSIVEYLVKAGADVNLQDIQKNTPLITVCKKGHVSIVEYLVKVGADVNLQDRWENTPLIAACEKGRVSIVEELVKAGANVNLQDRYGYTPLITVCKKGHVDIVEELVKAGADANLQDKHGYTPLIDAVRKGSLSKVKYFVEHEADLVTQIVDINVSAVYKALILNKPDIMKYLIQEQNKITPAKFNGNVHLFNCLVDIRHAEVKTDSRDDVVVTDRKVWCMDREGDLCNTISEGDCDVLRRLLCVGLDVNQSIQLYDKYHDYNSDVKPLLYKLIDDSVIDKVERVRILLEAGADVTVRVRYKGFDSVLDREDVSVLEMTRRLVCKYSDNDDLYKITKRVMCEIKKHVRRHSV